jgi:DNA-binding MarR family transcriptional regulator
MGSQRAASSTRTARRAAREHRALLAARALVDRMRGLYRELEQLTAAPIGMHRALNAIGAAPGIQASRLAQALGMQRPAVSQLLKGMAARGWIERRRGEPDQRAVQIHLTAGGQRMLKVTVGRAIGILQRAVALLDDADVERLAAALPRLLQNLPAVDGRSERRRPRRAT